MMKIWKLTLWKVSGVNDTLGHFLLRQSLSTKDFWERESLRFVPRDPKLLNATNKINVLIFALPIRLRARFCLAHIAYFIWSLWNSHKTLLASFSSNFLFGDIKRGRGNSSLNSWLIVRLGPTNILKQDDAFNLWKRHLAPTYIQFNSNNVANKLLHAGFIFSFMNFIKILIFT